MAGGKETPRQKMIGILYLVLLGFVALSVSDTVLESFKDLKKSLDGTSDLTNSKTEAIQKYGAKEAKDAQEQLKDETFAKLQRANNVIAAVKIATNYIKNLENELNPKNADSTVNDRNNGDVDVSYRKMIREGKAEELKKQLQKALASIQSNSKKNPTDSAYIPILKLDGSKVIDGKKLNWAEMNFGENLPLIAVLTNLSKIKADLKNDEAAVVADIIGGKIINPTNFKAVAVAPTSYLIKGQPYTADVFLTGYDKNSAPTITVNGSTIPVTDGYGKYTVSTGSVGEFTWNGKISLSGVEYETGPQKYQVAQPSAVVSAVKMNVIYAGIPNPFSVSAPGIALQNIQVSMTNGSISGSKGNYTVSSTSVGKTAVITVKATVGNNNLLLGSSTFRVMKLPDPVAYFAGTYSGASLSATQLAQQLIIRAVPDPSKEFVFGTDISYSIVSWKLKVFSPLTGISTGQGAGSTISGSAKNALKSISSGGVVWFYDIVAMGPDGVKRNIPPLIINAN
jgi:gliding motility-associated protein GldM